MLKNKVFKHFFVFLVLLITGLSCTNSDDETSYPRFSDQKVQEFRQIVNAIMEEENVPGLVVTVRVPGEGYWTEAFGKSNLETGETLELNDKFRMGSITKTYTVTVLLQLVDEGKIQLDDPLSLYMPDFPNSEAVTIRNLASNSSGIFDYTHDETFIEILENDIQTYFSPSQLVEFAKNHPPLFPPGTKYSYSNTNFVIIGMIIEQITGNSLNEEFENRIFKPLGLKNTSYPDGNSIPAPYTHGYMATNDEDELYDVTEINPSIAGSAGAMISDLEDVCTWCEALVSGALLTPQTQQERLKLNGFSDENKNLKYCLGIYYMGDFLGHDGSIFGYNTAMFYLPSRNATIVILSNKQCGSSLSIFMKLAENLFPEESNWSKKK
ncbi:MAG: serine hydrolase domain-containing protein [Vulcanimicrobiota bacterium]